MTKLSTLLRSSTLTVVAGGLLATTAAAQVGQVQAPGQPRPPSFQRPNIDPTNQAIAALRLRVDALRESAGRQIVVLHFPPTDLNSWLDAQNNFNANSARGEAVCKSALGNRYGRVVSRLAQPLDNGRWYFPNVVCETAP